MTGLENQNQQESAQILDNETCRQFATLLETATDKSQIINQIGNHIISTDGESMTIEQRAISGKLNMLAATPAALVMLYMQMSQEIAAPLSTHRTLSNKINQNYSSLTANAKSHNPALNATLNGVQKEVKSTIDIKLQSGSTVTIVIGIDYTVYRLDMTNSPGLLTAYNNVLANANEIIFPTDIRSGLGIDTSNTPWSDPNHRNTRLDKIEGSNLNGYQRFTYIQTLINTHKGLDFSGPNFSRVIELRDQYRDVLFKDIEKKFHNDNENGYFDKCDELAYQGNFYEIVKILESAKTEIITDLKSRCKIHQTPFGEQAITATELFVEQQIAEGAKYISRSVSNGASFNRREHFTDTEFVNTIKKIENGYLGRYIPNQTERAEAKNYTSNKILEYAFENSGIQRNKVRDGGRVYNYNIITGKFSSHGKSSTIDLENHKFKVDETHEFDTKTLGEDRFSFQETFRFANLIHFLITSYPPGQRRKITLGTEQKNLTMPRQDRPDFEAVNLDPMAANNNFANKEDMFRVYPSLKQMEYRQNREDAINNAFYSSN